MKVDGPNRIKEKGDSQIKVRVLPKDKLQLGWDFMFKVVYQLVIWVRLGEIQ